MASNFFSRFPKISYNIDGEGSFLTLTNIVNNVNINSLYANESTYYTYYEIADGDRPDTVSYKLYGTSEYHWTLFIINNELRNGLSDAWPLSNQQFEQMMANEYDKYSAITFLPVSETNNGLDESGLFNLTKFSSKYINFIKLANDALTVKANILRYDNSTLQLIIYDIRNVSDNALLTDTSAFMSEAEYRLIWENPFDENSSDPKELISYADCEALRVEFIHELASVYQTIDGGVIPEIDYGGTLDEINVGLLGALTNYVFKKKYIAANSEFRWQNLRNAARIYYEENSEGEKISKTAYDVISNQNVIVAKYLSNFDVEEKFNDKKTKIRVIRPDRIRDFVNEYFNVLNG